MRSGEVIELGGLALRIRVEDDAFAAATAGLLGEARRTDARADIHVDIDTTGPSGPTTAPARSYEDLDLWYRPDSLFLRHRSGVTAEATRETVSIGGTCSHPHWVIRRVLPLAATYPLAHRRRYLLHGAAVSIAGTALLATGLTGTGKSTLVAGALRRGWVALADDLVIVGTGADGTLEVSGLPRPLAVPAEVLPEDATGWSPIPGDPRRRYEAPLGTLTHGRARVGAVALMGHGVGAAGIRRAAGEDVVQQMIGMFACADHPALLRTYFPLAAALSRLPAWHLDHHPDPSRRLDAAGELLDEVAATFDCT